MSRPVYDSVFRGLVVKDAPADFSESHYMTPLRNWTRQMKLTFPRKWFPNVQLVGLPMRLAHATASSTTVGKVIGQYEPHHSLGVRFQIYKDTPLAQQTYKAITNETFNGLSLMSEMWVKWDKNAARNIISAVTPLEVSICAKGARAGTEFRKEDEQADIFKIVSAASSEPDTRTEVSVDSEIECVHFRLEVLASDMADHSSAPPPAASQQQQPGGPMQPVPAGGHPQSASGASVSASTSSASPSVAPSFAQSAPSAAGSSAAALSPASLPSLASSSSSSASTNSAVPAMSASSSSLSSAQPSNLGPSSPDAIRGMPAAEVALRLTSRVEELQKTMADKEADADRRLADAERRAKEALEAQARMYDEKLLMSRGPAMVPVQASAGADHMFTEADLRRISDGLSARALERTFPSTLVGGTPDVHMAPASSASSSSASSSSAGSDVARAADALRVAASAIKYVQYPDHSVAPFVTVKLNEQIAKTTGYDTYEFNVHSMMAINDAAQTDLTMDRVGREGYAYGAPRTARDARMGVRA